MRAPLDTIVIPTRDRAALLGGAIRSALAQTLGDLEIVISDNASSDGTAETVAAFEDERLRRVRTPRPMLMHDSWTFAVDQARGDRVTLLCDDDALHPRTLEIAGAEMEADDELDVVFWRACTHDAAEWFDESRRGCIAFGPPYGDRGVEVDPRRLVEDALRMRLSGRSPLPLMLNCMVSRSLLCRAAEAGTSLFRPSCPDYASILGLALHARRMLLLDAPLLVAGATGESIGADALQRGERARRYVAELLAGEPGLIMPPAVLTPACWRAQTYMQCIHDWPALAGREVDLVHTYALAAREIEAWRRADVPVDDLDRELTELLDGLGADGQSVRRLVEAGVDLESEAYLGATTGPDRVLGIGPFTLERSHRRFDGADAAAAAIDGVLRAEAVPLERLWREIDVVAGDRDVILYGLGGNGRALARLTPTGDAASRHRILAHDDAPSEPPAGVEMAPAPEHWSPRRHLVVITPDDHAAIARRLDRLGFVDGRDRVALRPAAVAAAGSPSGCR